MNQNLEGKFRKDRGKEKGGGGHNGVILVDKTAGDDVYGCTSKIQVS